MNPFRETIVANPWDETCVDVTDIHRAVFDACLNGIEQVRTSQRSTALLIHGEAGSGKTHLLSRLRSQLAPRAATATDRPESLFVWVRLQTSPRMIWRTLRRTLVNDWFRPVSGHRSQFDRILFHRLAEIRVAEGDLEPWYEYMLDEDPRGLQDLMERIAESLDLDRNTAIAFEHIAFNRHRRDLRAWLAGQSLPEAALARMDLSQDEGTDEEREDQARQVVLMLCQLAGRGLPIVLSFDQVEALQMSPRDLDGQFAFGQMVGTIHDATHNVLIVSCVQSSFFSDLRNQIRGADYDRLTSLGAVSLDPLNSAEAEQLIAARLQMTGTAVPAHAVKPSCWPLDPAEFARLFAKSNLTPRRLLGLCAERWESSQDNASFATAENGHPPAGSGDVASDRSAAGPVTTPGVIDDYLDEKWRTTVDQKLAAGTPDQTEEIVRHGLPLLAQLLFPDMQTVHDELLPDVPLIFDTPGGRTGLSVRTESNMNSAGAKLKHLLQQWGSGRLKRLIIVRDSRRPLTKTAKAAQKSLDELQQRGVVVVFPTAEVLAALDTLRELLSDAKSGDLDCRGETILPRTLEEWLTSHVSSNLREFITQVLEPAAPSQAEPVVDAFQIEELNTLLSQSPMLPLQEAETVMKIPNSDILQIIRQYPEQFGVLGEPPQFVFRIVEATEIKE